MLMVGMAPAYPQAVPEPPAGQSDLRPLRIATRLMRPDAFEDKGQLVGFSIDIGQAVVQQIQRNQPQRKTTLKAYAGVPEILAALRSGEADLGLAAIPITSQQEREFDFSHPILSAGLQIMVPDPGEQTRPAEQAVVRRIFKPDLLRLTGIVALLMLIPAHILWYFERKN
jgi:polar amino acid transport system substrate-binding protein